MLTNPTNLSLPNNEGSPEEYIDAVLAAPIEHCWSKIGVWGDRSCPELKEYIHCQNCPVYINASTKLLDIRAPKEYQDEWLQYYSSIKKSNLENESSVFIFRIGDEWYGLPIQIFKEVCEARSIHKIPHIQDAHILGISNVRGELLVCLALDKILGISKSTKEELSDTNQNEYSKSPKEYFLVFTDSNRRFVCVAQEVGNIHRYTTEELKQIPATIDKALAAHTKGIIQWKNNTVIILEENILTSAFSRTKVSN